MKMTRRTTNTIILLIIQQYYWYYWCTDAPCATNNGGPNTKKIRGCLVSQYIGALITLLHNIDGPMILGQ